MLDLKKWRLKTWNTGIVLLFFGVFLITIAGTLLFLYARRTEYQSAVLRKTVSSLSGELAKRGESIAVHGVLNREKATAVRPTRWLLQLDNPVTVGGDKVTMVELSSGDRRLFDLEGERVGVVGVPVRLASPDGGLTAAIVPGKIAREETPPSAAAPPPP